MYGISQCRQVSRLSEGFDIHKYIYIHIYIMNIQFLLGFYPYLRVEFMQIYIISQNTWRSPPPKKGGQEEFHMNQSTGTETFTF